ncbi:dynamin family protein [Corynebacterium durum]|uniref:dynamin family protein n=1 Tax=Corynebacterium durum TaxID=61592 RepID=UPI0015CE8EB2|nr:dynamin family protein [Corynebacterium durum]NYI74248.1 GTP-binding protein EngB required for normal cell division/predicted nucleic acid-binding Zn-ribbon protein [Corynebacterium durum]WJY85968.1 Isoniazid-induced protein IniA [Corynebacterium durum]
MSHGSPAAASRTPEESVTRAADIARRYGQDSAADRAVQMLNATFRAGTVVVMGEVKRGKSSLVNALIAQPDLLPVDVLTCTSAPIRVAVSHDGPVVPQVTLVRGTEREMILATELARWVTVDGVGSLQGNTNAGLEESQDPPSSAEISVRYPDMDGITVVDTPGVGGLDKRAVTAALQEARHAGVLLMVCDASTPITAPEMDILRQAHDSVGGVIVAVTKTDKNTRRWRAIVEDNKRLISSHMGIDVPVVGVSSLRALDAARCIDPARRAELERRSGIAQLRSQLRAQLRQPAAMGQRAALQSITTTLTGIAKTVRDDIRLLAESSTAVEQLEAEKTTLERLREESSEFEQRFQRDLAVARTRVTEGLDKALEEVRHEWTQQINADSLRVLRSKPQVFTSQIETELAVVMEDTVGAMVEEISELASALFPDRQELIAEIMGTTVASLTPAEVSGHEVEKKTKDIIDPSVLMMGMIGSGALAAIIPVAPLAGAVWVGVNLGYRAMRNGKQHLITWLRETTASVRTATTRMLDTLITTARTDVMLRYRADLRTKIKELHGRIDQAREAARESEGERQERSARLTRNVQIIEATIAELGRHLQQGGARA